MSVHKRSVSFTESEFAFVRQLVEEGEYASVSAAVSGELARAKAIRDHLIFGPEVERRLRLPVDQWAPIGALDEVTRSARAYLQKLAESKDKALRG